MRYDRRRGSSIATPPTSWLRTWFASPAESPDRLGRYRVAISPEPPVTGSCLAHSAPQQIRLRVEAFESSKPLRVASRVKQATPQSCLTPQTIPWSLPQRSIGP